MTLRNFSTRNPLLWLWQAMLRFVFSAAPLLIGVILAVVVVVFIINWEGTVLDATVVSMTLDTQEEARDVLNRLRGGESFEAIAEDMGEDVPFSRTITPSTAPRGMSDEEVDEIFSEDVLDSFIGPYEVRRGWYVARVDDLTLVDSTDVYDLIYDQTLATAENRANMIDFFLPILLCSVGLVLTFTAGLWNIGIEGQVAMGAVGAGSIALFANDIGLPRNQLIAAELTVAAAAGGTWALLAAILRTRGGVNEIFGGVALNFVASNFSTFLVVDAWAPPGSTNSTSESFPTQALLPAFGDYKLSKITVYISVLAFTFVFMTLVGSRWGLQLKAMGRNQRSAEVLGIATERNIWLVMTICGALAGLAGAHLVLFRRGNLPATASGGIGFLALLVVLLASIRILWVPLISLVFSGLMIGGLPLRTRLSLDASLVGVMIGVLVFFVFIFEGVRQRLVERTLRQQVPVDEAAAKTQTVEMLSRQNLQDQFLAQDEPPPKPASPDPPTDPQEE